MPKPPQNQKTQCVAAKAKVKAAAGALNTPIRQQRTEKGCPAA